MAQVMNFNAAALEPLHNGVMHSARAASWSAGPPCSSALSLRGLTMKHEASLFCHRIVTNRPSRPQLIHPDTFAEQPAACPQDSFHCPLSQGPPVPPVPTRFEMRRILLNLRRTEHIPRGLSHQNFTLLAPSTFEDEDESNGRGAPLLGARAS